MAGIGHGGAGVPGLPGAGREPARRGKWRVPSGSGELSVGATLDRDWRRGLGSAEPRARGGLRREPDAVWKDVDIDAGHPARNRGHGADHRAGTAVDLLRALAALAEAT